MVSLAPQWDFLYCYDGILICIETKHQTAVAFNGAGDDAYRI